MISDTVVIRLLGKQDYLTVWQAMQQFTTTRDDQTADEIWLLEHHPVFTQGQNGKPEHLLNPGLIPVVQTDRGGQITYHGPGQLVAYTLVNLQRKKLNVRQMVSILENSVIQLLKDYGIDAKAKLEAPGIYVTDKKICSIGLRIRRGSAYHGLALNVAMDLEPFTRINPCGFKQLEMTQIANSINAPNHLSADLPTVTTKLVDYLIKNLGYNSKLIKN